MKRIEKDKIRDLVAGQVLFEEPLKKYTSFQIGGPAEILVIPKDLEDLQKLIKYLYKQQISYQVIGNGTNLLISDQGLRDVVIKLNKVNNIIKFVDNKLITGGGVNLPVLAKKAAQRGLSGLEFATGLPATVGGAVVMNAGTELGSIADLLLKVKVLAITGDLKVYEREDLEFNYRSSKFQSHSEIIYEVEMELNKGDKELIIDRMREILVKRKGNQPLSLPNAGCIFVNPSSDSAGRMIDEAGGKGLQIGDAQISTKHANFIVNLGNATAEDVLNLIERVKGLVYNKYGINLEQEIKFLE